MAAGSKKVILAALIGNGLIAVTKFVAASITHSSAMLSEGIHSVVDTGNQVLLLHGLARSKRPPDSQFPYGHGKELYFWSFIVAIMIFAVGAGVSIYEGIERLLHPEPVENVIVNYVVLGFAIIFEGGAWYFAWREFDKSKGTRSYVQAVQQGKDPTLFVVLFEDSAAMAGLLVALLGVALGQWTGNPMWDGAASVAIGLILGGTAAWLAYETKGLLIGESANPEVVARIQEIAHNHAQILRVNEVLTMHIGPEFILANVSVEFEDNASAENAEEVIHEIDRRIKEQMPRVKRIFIELEDRTVPVDQPGG